MPNSKKIARYCKTAIENITQNNSKNNNKKYAKTVLKHKETAKKHRSQKTKHLPL